MRQQFAPAAPGDVGKSDALRCVFGSVFASVRLFAQRQAQITSLIKGRLPALRCHSKQASKQATGVLGCACLDTCVVSTN
jgi:hypothetical protein